MADKSEHIMTIEKREVKLHPEETIESVLDLCRGCKYVNPTDENERGYNRGIDKCMVAIEDYLETFTCPDADIKNDL